MSDPFDVSLRVKLERAGFSEGKADVADLKKASEGLGRTSGPDRLARDLRDVDRAATEAGRDLERSARQAAQLGATPGPAKLKRELQQAAVEGKAVSTALVQVEASARGADRDHLGRFRKSAGEAAQAVRGVDAAIVKADQSAVVFDRERYGRFNRGTDAARQQLERLRQKMNEVTRADRGMRDTGVAAEFLAGSARGAFGALAAFAAPAAILHGLSQVADKFLEVDRAASRTAMTAELRDPATRKQVIESNKGFAKLGARQSQIQSARDVYGAQLGASIPDQNTMLDPTLRASVAYGTSSEVMAQAGSAYIRTMKGKPEELSTAIDMMAKGGKLGSFETGAMAQNLPQLGSQYAASGGTGLKGLSELIAMAQVAAIGAGSEGEASTNLTNFLSTLYSPETVENFKKRGVSVRRVTEDARAQGQNPALAMLDVTQKLTRGDPIRMGQLFGNQQASSALRPLMENREKLSEFQREIENNSEGTVEKDFQFYRGTAGGREDVRQAKREASQLTIGEGSQGLNEWFSGVQSRFMEHMAGISKLYTEHGALPAFEGALGARSTLNVPRAPTRDEAQSLDKLRNEQADLERELSLGAMTGVDSKPLQDRLDRLTSAIRDLERKLSGEGDEAKADPINFRGLGFGSGRARVMNASLGGGGRVRGGGSSADDETMVGPRRSSSRGGTSAGPSSVLDSGPVGTTQTTRNPGGAAGEVYDVLSSGLPDHQALALLGHVDQESGFDPGAWNDKESAGGLLQWRGNRLDNLKSFAAKRGMPWQDRQTQAAFILHEMKTDPYERERSAGFRNAKSLEEASAQLKSYVRFGDNSAGSRLEKGRGWAEKFGAKSGGAGAVAAGGSGRASVSYSNQGATRNKPVTPELLDQIQRGVSAVYGDGYKAEIYSGGQAAKGSGGRRTGSTRHDDHGHGGEAADVYVVGPDGKRVTGDDLGRLGQHWSATKQGGVGMEMRGGGIHLDQHKDRAPHWNYANQGGRYTAGQREAMRLGLAGIPPAYANPGALSDQAVADGAASTTGDLPSPKSAPTPASRPTRQPAVMPPASGSRSGGTAGGMTVTQNFHGGFDAAAVYRRSQRESGRAIRSAEARALHDTIAPTA